MYNTIVNVMQITSQKECLPSGHSINNLLKAESVLSDFKSKVTYFESKEFFRILKAAW